MSNRNLMSRASSPIAQPKKAKRPVTDESVESAEKIESTNPPVKIATGKLNSKGEILPLVVGEDNEVKTATPATDKKNEKVTTSKPVKADFVPEG